MGMFVLLLIGAIIAIIVVWVKRGDHGAVQSSGPVSNPFGLLPPLVGEYVNNETYARLFAANSSWVILTVFSENNTLVANFTIHNVTTEDDGSLLVIGTGGEQVVINATDPTFTEQGLLEIFYIPPDSGPGRRRLLSPVPDFCRIHYNVTKALRTIPVSLVDGAYFDNPDDCLANCPQAQTTCVHITIQGHDFGRCDLTDHGTDDISSCQKDCAVVCLNNATCLLPVRDAICIPSLGGPDCPPNECVLGTSNCSVPYYTCEDTLDSWICHDVDECANASTHSCSADFICINTVGGYNCDDIDECANNTTNNCTEGYQCVNLLGSFRCDDVNECLIVDCTSGWDCINTVGGWHCQDHNECLDQCLRSSGYNCTNTVGSFICEDVNECANDTLNNCTSPFYTCNNLPGTFNCSNVNECSLGLDNCTEGYFCIDLPGSYFCSDVDECDNDTLHNCSAGYECFNVEGGYNCTDVNECETETDNCTEGYQCFNYDGGFNCTDVDECTAGTHNCSPHFFCVNSPGGWACDDVNECAGEINPCGSGFNCTNVVGSYSCFDLDECDMGTDNCTEGYVCENEPGSFSCPDFNECLSEETFNCTTGYACFNTPGSYECQDVNECELLPCDPGYSCTNTPGSYDCFDINECLTDNGHCPPGTGCQNNDGSFICYDLDECELGTHDCGVGFTCQNVVTSFNCNDINECLLDPCSSGYVCENTEGSFQCNDFDECAAETYDCDLGYECSNTPGSYDCVNINECNSGPVCGNGYDCIDTPGGFDCPDINECDSSPCDSGYDCVNTDGSYTCDDIDECTTGTHDCGSGYECYNTGGGFGCNNIDECDRGTDNCTDGVQDCFDTAGSYDCVYCRSFNLTTGQQIDTRCPQLPIFLLPVINGNLGGPNGADLLCETEAVLHGLPGSQFRAILAANRTNSSLDTVASRIEPMAWDDLTRAFVLPNHTVFLSSFDAIGGDDGNSTFAQQMTLNVYANGSLTLSNERVWDVALTGVEWLLAPWGYEQMPDYGSDNDCDGWTSSSSHKFTHVGAAAAYWDSSGKAWGYTLNLLYPSSSRLGRVSCDGNANQMMSYEEPNQTPDSQRTVFPRFNIYCAATSTSCGPGAFLAFWNDTLRRCVDVDECSEPGTCSPGWTCVNTPGSYQCIEPESDVDECAQIQDQYPCHPDAYCNNTWDGFNCTCKEGFEGDGIINCTDIDECLAVDKCGNYEDGYDCINLPGSYDCLACRFPAIGGTWNPISRLCPMVLVYSVMVPDTYVPNGLASLDDLCMQTPDSLPLKVRQYPYNMRAWVANATTTPVTHNLPFRTDVPLVMRTDAHDNMYEIQTNTWTDVLVPGNVFSDFNIPQDGMDNLLVMDIWYLWGMTSNNFTIATQKCNNWKTRSVASKGTMMHYTQWGGWHQVGLENCNRDVQAVICTATTRRECPFPYEIDPRYPQHCTRKTNLCLTELNQCEPSWTCYDPMDASGHIQCADISAYSGPGWNCSAPKSPNFFFTPSCDDVDECEQGTDSCGEGLLCHNTPGSYSCLVIP